MKLEQVLVEIISNALDAMPGGGRLRVRAGEAALEGRPGIEIEISDTGPGIPNQVLSRVCEPFFTTRPEGTGLGLAIAKRFIDQHGGRLDLFSPVGEGAHARIWLPLPAAESALVGAISTPLAGPS
jgi:signal transduction histidine kinase